MNILIIKIFSFKFNIIITNLSNLNDLYFLILNKVFIII